MKKHHKKKVSTDGQLCFRVFGGPHDGERLFLRPPIWWEEKDLVLPSQRGDGIWHNYRFSRITWTARYLGILKKNDGQAILHEER